MRYFVGLVHNEWMKANSKRQVPYFFAFIAVITLLVAVMRRFIYKSDAYHYVSFVGEMGFLFLLIGISIIVIAAQMITDEYRDGTIKQLLIRPASRTMVFASKMATSILILLSMYVFTFVFSLVIGLIFFRFIPINLTSIEILESTNMPVQFTLIEILKGILFLFPEALFYTLLAMTVAVLTRSQSLSITVPIVMKTIVGAVVISYFASELWYKYLIFPHLDWQPYFDSARDLSYKGASLGFSVVIYAGYIIMLLGLSLFVFNKRDVQ